MIESGWIFPDGTEYSCGRDSFTVHDLVVMRFVKGLKSQDMETYRIVKKEIDDLYERQGSRNLYANYAIRRLGWIKIGTSIWDDIKYAGYHWQSDLIKPYEEKGYRLLNMYVSSSYYLPLKCDISRAIRDGKIFI